MSGPRWRADVVADDGSRARLTVTAASSHEAQRHLRADGWVPLRVRRVGSGASRRHSRRLDPDDEADVAAAIASSWRAGRGVGPALREHARQARRGGVRRVCTELAEALDQGTSLTGALSQTPEVSPVLSTYVEISASDGGRADAADGAVRLLRRLAQLRRHARRAAAMSVVAAAALAVATAASGSAVASAAAAVGVVLVAGVARQPHSERMGRLRRWLLGSASTTSAPEESRAELVWATTMEVAGKAGLPPTRALELAAQATPTSRVAERAYDHYHQALTGERREEGSVVSPQLTAAGADSAAQRAAERAATAAEVAAVAGAVVAAAAAVLTSLQ